MRRATLTTMLCLICATCWAVPPVQVQRLAKWLNDEHGLSYDALAPNHVATGGPGAVLHIAIWELDATHGIAKPTDGDLPSAESSAAWWATYRAERDADIDNQKLLKAVTLVLRDEVEAIKRVVTNALPASAEFIPAKTAAEYKAAIVTKFKALP